jgi:tetratricopeptide (TPR) repeat protein
MIAAFFGCKVMGRERVFLFLIFPFLMISLGVGLYFLLLHETRVPDAPASASPAQNPEKPHAPPMAPLELIRQLEAAERLEREAPAGSERTGTAQAMEIYEKILAGNPESDRAWAGLGWCLNVKGDFRAALDALDHACRLNVVDAGYFSARAEAKRALGDLRAAVADFSDSVRLRPGNVIATNQMLMTALEAEDITLYDLKLADIAKSRSAGADATWVMGAAAREVRSGNFEGGRALVKQARELLHADQVEILLADPVFSDRRGKEFLASLE